MRNMQPTCQSSPALQTEWHRRRGRQLLLAKVRMSTGRIGIFANYIYLYHENDCPNREGEFPFIAVPSPVTQAYTRKGAL